MINCLDVHLVILLFKPVSESCVHVMWCNVNQTPLQAHLKGKLVVGEMMEYVFVQLIFGVLTGSQQHTGSSVSLEKNESECEHEIVSQSIYSPQTISSSC